MSLYGALEPSMLRRLLRRVTVTAIALGCAGFIVALLVGPPLGALGVVLGVCAGFLNARAVDRQISRSDVDPTQPTKVVRRAVGTRSLLRLGAITAVALVLLVILPPLGIGIVVGLVIFQLAFIGNVIQLVFAQGGVA